MDLPELPVWQTLLAAAPTGCALIAALLAVRATQPAQAWRAARLGVGAAGLSAILLIATLCIGGAGRGAGLRIDLVGVITTTLVTFIASVIVRFSRSYLAGDPGELRYVRWLMMTLAGVLLVLTSNHLLILALAWTASSLALHRLLVFFADRPAARIAAHKKFIAARLADICMLIATCCLYFTHGTWHIDELLTKTIALGTQPLAVQAAAVLIAAAAIFKCAQLPFHGWLIQVMEAPTPVSAFLHAGIVNLGGFILIRLAVIISRVDLAMNLLVIVGCTTAVLAALVMTTRISIKVALAWSTCAQMGFMLMQCGLGLWEMALLHLVAHSLYKAHTFLSAGDMVRQTLITRMLPATAAASTGALLIALLIGSILSLSAMMVWGLSKDASLSLWVLAGIVAGALATFLHTYHGKHVTIGSDIGAIGVAFVVACAYFGFHALLHPIVAPQAVLPSLWTDIYVATAFLALFFLQHLLRSHKEAPLAKGLYPWLYGGFYLDAYVTRAMFRTWPLRNTSSNTSTEVAR